MFRPQARLQDLANLSRNLGVGLNSGVPITRCFEIAATRATGKLNVVLEDVLREVKSGTDVATAFGHHRGYFPPLFVDMVAVGEHSGALPEVLKELAVHYEKNIRLRKDFLGQIALPVIQLVAAVLIVAVLILVLGFVANLTGGVTDVLGWGLIGVRGAATWLGGWVMGVIAIYVLWRLATVNMQGKKLAHLSLMRVPMLGQCLRSFAIARFSWAFALTQQSGMAILESLRSSLKATANGAFIAATPGILNDVKSGETVTQALDNTGLFPVEYIETCLVGETSGTLPEALDRLSPEFEDAARRSLQALTAMLAWLIWAAVAAFIIFLIFTLAMFYINQLSDALQPL